MQSQLAGRESELKAQPTESWPLDRPFDSVVKSDHRRHDPGASGSFATGADSNAMIKKTIFILTGAGHKMRQ
jgi:hypothetical protein